MVVTSEPGPSSSMFHPSALGIQAKGGRRQWDRSKRPCFFGRFLCEAVLPICQFTPKSVCALSVVRFESTQGPKHICFVVAEVFLLLLQKCSYLLTGWRSGNVLGRGRVKVSNLGTQAHTHTHARTHARATTVVHLRCTRHQANLSSQMIETSTLIFTTSTTCSATL